ncbi:hypothetical protein LIER_04637 [Lithospermum erythrorhizon]|uniref:Uncharacterized protein n=1 Tax=Lithospermum erythrorhizon TaxID=34254 RepID=A0AAV3NXW1_LITER
MFLMCLMIPISGVYNFKMIGNGKIIVSGKVDPTKLLKFIAKAGKTAEVLWWQFGECSSNLFLPINQHYSITNSSQYGYGSIGVYGGGGGFYDNGYGGNSYYQGGYGGSSHLDDLPCPLRQKSEQDEPMKCCTIM